MLERNKEQECITLFQQVRIIGPADWTWHLTSVKILLRDDAGKPVLTIGISIPVDPEHHITNKVSRLLEENNFLRKNLHQFGKLSKREKQILKLMALGKSSAEIAADLFISTTTAETHRRNIRQKLNAETGYELSQYALAFDLI
jgi:DNA-binding CsgD family transcriptional regulator